jgi:hypothetical protein
MSTTVDTTKSEADLMHERGFVTVITASRAVHRHTSRIYAALDAGEIKGDRIGRNRYVKWESLVAWITREGDTALKLYKIAADKLPPNVEPEGRKPRTKVRVRK